MKKEKIKSILILSIVSILLIMLTGCGTTKEKNEEEKSNNTSNNEQSNEAKQDEEVTTNVAEFVKYKDATYFWKLSANSRENTGLFAKYSTNQNTKNELIKLDSSGNQTTVLTEKALGNICISNDKIFMQGTESESGSYNKIYSTDMNGENKKEYQKGEIIKSIKGYVICQNENIFAINTKTDEIVNLKEKANVIDVIDNVIYYSDDTESNTLKIGTIKDNKDNGTIATFLRKDLFKESTDQPMEIVEFGEDDGKIKCYIGYRDGTAHMLQDEYCFTMNKDGSNLQKESVQNLENENDQKLKGVYINSKSVNGKIVNDLVYVDESTKERKTILTQKEINEKLEKGEFKGEKGDQGEKGEKGEKGESGEIATAENAGIVKPDGETITIDPDGTIHGQSVGKNPLTKVYFNYGSYFPGSSFEESAQILAGYDLICCEGSISGWTDSEKRQNEMALVQEVSACP